MIRDVARTFRQCWRPLVVADLVFKVAGALLIGPIVALAFRAFVEFTGREVLADEDILRFVTSPVGVLCLVCVGGLLVATLVLEQAVLLRILWANAAGRPARIRSAMAGAAADTWTTVKLGALLVASAAVLALPYAVVAGLVYCWLLTGHDINYYLAEKPAAFWWALGLGAVVAAVAGVAIGWWLVGRVLAIPLVVVRKMRVRESIARSVQLTRGRHWQLLRPLAIWLAAVLGLPPLLLAGYVLVGSWLATRTESLQWLTVLVGGLTLVHFALNLLVHVATVVSFALVIWSLWRELDTAADEAIDRQAAVDQALADPRPAWSTLRVLAVLVVMLLVAGLIGAGSLAGVNLVDDTEIIAHRGGAAHAPENSLSAIRQAIRDGADWVEIDVQETKDGRVVLVHDRDFKRQAGDAIEVHTATLAEIEQLDIGSSAGSDFAGERVATLAAVLDLTKGHVGMVIELKHYGFNQRLEERVIELVEERGMESEVMIISLDRASIAKVRKLRPTWPIGLLTAVKLGNLARVDANLLAVRKDLANAGFIGRAHFAGREVAAWTLNDRESLERMTSRGVDYLITDDVPLAQQVLAERRELSLPERWLRAVAADL